MALHGVALLLLLALTTAALSGCSIRRFVAGGVANSLASGPDVFSSDDDPELVRDAIPFGLKTMESLLQIVPRHRALLLALCRGFTQYSYAFIEDDADRIEPTDFARATEIRERARRLFVRAHDYGLRCLERDYRGITQQLRLDPEKAVTRLRVRDVPAMYWTAASWGSAISLGKDRPELVADLPAVRALIDRAARLDEGYEGGALHEALIILDALPPAMGGSPERAREHFRRAVELSKGERPGPFVTMAQSISVMTQNRTEFRELLERALAIDPDRDSTQRLVTLITQRKARELLQREDELFLEGEGATPDTIPPDTTRHEDPR
jgi:predicted anti-sigma-YlaC factor YlaD